MELKKRIIKEFSDIPGECVHMKALVTMSREEYKLLSRDPDEEPQAYDNTINTLFETAGCAQPYRGVPGHRYVSQPWYHLRLRANYRGAYAVVTQQSGLDI